ncbi:hypothetical protein M432DRAFT_476896 [Thermoascus aurantiacus ATCC 26904]
MAESRMLHDRSSWEKEQTPRLTFSCHVLDVQLSTAILCTFAAPVPLFLQTIIALHVSWHTVEVALLLYASLVRRLLSGAQHISTRSQLEVSSLRIPERTVGWLPFREQIQTGAPEDGRGSDTSFPELLSKPSAAAGVPSGCEHARDQHGTQQEDTRG